MEIFERIRDEAILRDDGDVTVDVQTVVSRVGLLGTAASAILESWCLRGDSVVGIGEVGAALGAALADRGKMRLFVAQDDVPKDARDDARTWIVVDVLRARKLKRKVLDEACGTIAFVSTEERKDVLCFARFDVAAGVWSPGRLCFTPSGVCGVASATHPRVVMGAPGVSRLTLSHALQHGLQPFPIKWRSFAEGGSGVIVPQAELLRGLEVDFIMDATDPESLIDQLAVLRIVCGQGAKRVRAVVPYLPIATDDRVGGDLAPAMCETLHMLAAAAGGAEIVLVDPHSKVVPCIAARRVSSLQNVLHEVCRSDADLLVFPEESEASRAFADEVALRGGPVRTLSFGLVREGGKVTKLVPVDFAGAKTAAELVASSRSIAVVEPLVTSGGTIAAALRALEDFGAAAGSATVYVSHLATANTHAALSRIARQAVCGVLAVGATTNEAFKAAAVPELKIRIGLALEGSSRPTPVCVVGTQSAVKLRAARALHDGIVLGVSVPSGVPESPFNDDGPKGARNRALAARQYIRHLISTDATTEKSIVRLSFLGIENYIDTTQWLDLIACHCEQRNKILTSVHPCAPVPKSLRKPNLDISKHSQATLVLRRKDDWIRTFGISRENKIVEAIKALK